MWLTLEYGICSKPFELVSLCFIQMFLLVRQCAEPMTQLQRLKIKVTVQGQRLNPWIFCLLHISEPFERFLSSFCQMLISLRQFAEPLIQLHRVWVKAHLEFLVCSISQETLKKNPLNFDQMFIWMWRYVEPTPLSCHSLYNKMLQISDCLFATGDYSCPSTALL